MDNQNYIPLGVVIVHSFVHKTISILGYLKRDSLRDSSYLLNTFSSIILYCFINREYSLQQESNCLIQFRSSTTIISRSKAFSITWRRALSPSCHLMNPDNVATEEREKRGKTAHNAGWLQAKLLGCSEQFLNCKKDLLDP